MEADMVRLMLVLNLVGVVGLFLVWRLIVTLKTRRLGAYVPDDLLEDWFAPGTGMNPLSENALAAAAAYGQRFECEFKHYPERGSVLEMGARDMNETPLETKAITAVIEELERQAAENPSKLEVRRSSDKITVNGEVDVDAIVMVVVGSMAGGP